MAEKKKAETVIEESPVEKKKADPSSKAYWEELVPFFAFKDRDRYAGDITVGVNGKFWHIQRGVEVMIPRKVAEVLRQSREQDNRTAMMIDQKVSEAAEEARRYE